MVKASAKRADGRVLIVLGISKGNVDRLKKGDPIYFDPAALRIAPGTAIGGITLFYGADEAELTRTLRTLIGPQRETGMTREITAPRLQELAKTIAERLFTNGSGEHAQRLVLTIDTPTPRDLGGWCQGAVVDHIADILRAAGLSNGR